jgi:hypothetical protein
MPTRYRWIPGSRGRHETLRQILDEDAEDGKR